MAVKEAGLEETPYGRYVTSDGWFVVNLEDALAVRMEQGGAMYPLETPETPFRDFGARVVVLSQAIRTRSTTRRACRKAFSCSRASAR
jgi:hypothetical protein